MSFVFDTFTDASETDLASHIGEVGATWTHHASWGVGGASRISSNVCLATTQGVGGSHESAYYASGVPSSPDYEVSAKVSLCQSGSGYVDLFARMDLSGTRFPLGYSAHCSNGNLSIYRDSNYGTGAILAGPVTLPDSVVVTLKVQGSTITALINGVVVLSVVDTTYTAAGRVGFSTCDIGYYTQFDNFTAEYLLVPGILTPSGIPSGGLLGTPTIVGRRGPIRPSSIAPGAMGAPVVTGGTRVVRPTGISSLGGVGSPTIGRPVLMIAPTGVPSGAAFGTLSIDISSLPPGPTPTPPLDYVPLQQDNSRYKFVITDMMGNPKGEVLDCSNKEFVQVLSNMQIARFTTKISNPMADYILQNDCLCKCYRQPVDRVHHGYRLLLTGDVVTEDETMNNETGTITFTVVDPLNRLMWRMLGKGVDSNNHGIGFSSGTPTDTKDICDIVGDMLLDVNGDPILGFTGVTMGTRVAGTPQTYLETVSFQPFATQLAIYTNALDGLDFWLEPREPFSLAAYPARLGSPYIPAGPPKGTPRGSVIRGTSVQDTVIAQLNLYYPVGNYQKSAGPPPVFSRKHPFPVFEYGVGKHNIQGYQRLRDRSQVINQWFSLPEGFPLSNSSDDHLIVSQRTQRTPEGSVGTSINRRGGYESVDPTSLGADTGVGVVTGGVGVGSGAPTVSSLKQALVNSDAATTAVPRQQIVFTPTINCDVDWSVDYFVGDIVTVRAYVAEGNHGRGSWRFNGTVRIFGVDASIDDNEQEQIQITTIPTGASMISGA